MKLLLMRRPTHKRTTLGDLYVDGSFFCFTLEDAIREVPGQPVEKWKVPGETAIPSGLYRLELVDSPRFGPDTLSLKKTPGFEDIRIDAGNDDADTAGCILVGMNSHNDPDGDGGNISRSREALDRLKAVLVPELQSKRQVWISVKLPLPFRPA